MIIFRQLHSMSFFHHIPVLVDAYKYVLEYLQPVKRYPYHNIAHTLDVFGRAHVLCVAEMVSEREMTQVLLSALFHDTGFVQTYSKNETIGMEIARNWLQNYGYPEKDIRVVESLIFVTTPQAEIKSLPEAIIHDADLDNFGRDDCFSKMYAVEEELRAHTALTTKEIYDLFLDLHVNMVFKTPTGKKERDVKKQQNKLHFLKIYEEATGIQPSYTFETNIIV